MFCDSNENESLFCEQFDKIPAVVIRINAFTEERVVAA
jgi:hypothetical protein